MSLEKQILERKTRQMAEDIDFGVLAEMLKEQGWTEVHIPVSIEYMRAMKHTFPEMIEWCHSQGIVYKTATGWWWLFRNEQDSVAFTLRWL